MLNHIAIVEARLESERLRARLVRKLGTRSLLEFVVRRVTDCARLNGVVVVVGDDFDGTLARDLVPSDVEVFTSSGRDALSRFCAVLDHYQPDGVVHVCAENPFIDPVLIDQLVISAGDGPDCDYVGFRCRDGRPATSTSLGLFAEWCRPAALRVAEQRAIAVADRNDATSYLYSHPDEFDLRLLPAPPGLDRDDLRLTIESEEDWDHAQVIFEALGPEELDWQRIAGLLRGQPGLRQRMAVLNRA
jgi:spore coat polysaccharide biosynthesis protein SpsF